MFGYYLVRHLKYNTDTIKQQQYPLVRIATCLRVCDCVNYISNEGMHRIKPSGSIVHSKYLSRLTVLFPYETI